MTAPLFNNFVMLPYLNEMRRWAEFPDEMVKWKKWQAWVKFNDSVERKPHDLTFSNYEQIKFSQFLKWAGREDASIFMALYLRACFGGADEIRRWLQWRMATPEMMLLELLRKNKFGENYILNSGDLSKASGDLSKAALVWATLFWRLIRQEKTSESGEGFSFSEHFFDATDLTAANLKGVMDQLKVWGNVVFDDRANSRLDEIRKSVKDIIFNADGGFPNLRYRDLVWGALEPFFRDGIDSDTKAAYGHFLNSLELALNLQIKKRWIPDPLTVANIDPSQIVWRLDEESFFNDVARILEKAVVDPHPILLRLKLAVLAAHWKTGQVGNNLATLKAVRNEIGHLIKRSEMRELLESSEEIRGSQNGDPLERMQFEQVIVPSYDAVGIPGNGAIQNDVVFGIPTGLKFPAGSYDDGVALNQGNEASDFLTGAQYPEVRSRQDINQFPEGFGRKDRSDFSIQEGLVNPHGRLPGEHRGDKDIRVNDDSHPRVPFELVRKLGELRGRIVAVLQTVFAWFPEARPIAIGGFLVQAFQRDAVWPWEQADQLVLQRAFQLLQEEMRALFSAWRISLFSFPFKWGVNMPQMGVAVNIYLSNILIALLAYKFIDSLQRPAVSRQKSEIRDQRSEIRNSVELGAWSRPQSARARFDPASRSEARSHPRIMK